MENASIMKKFNDLIFKKKLKNSKTILEKTRLLESIL